MVIYDGIPINLKTKVLPLVQIGVFAYPYNASLVSKEEMPFNSSIALKKTQDYPRLPLLENQCVRGKSQLCSYRGSCRALTRLGYTPQLMAAD